MTKTEAKKLLKCNQNQLAAILCLNPSYLSRLPALSDAHVKIIEGELAKRELADVKTSVANMTGNKATSEDQSS